MSVMLDNKRTDATRPQFHDRRDSISRSRDWDWAPDRRHATRPQLHDRRDAISRSHDRNPDRRHVTQIAAEEEEMALVARYVFALAFLGITPLIVFLISHYFQLWFWSPM